MCVRERDPIIEQYQESKHGTCCSSCVIVRMFIICLLTFKQLFFLNFRTITQLKSDVTTSLHLQSPTISLVQLLCSSHIDSSCSPPPLSPSTFPSPCPPPSAALFFAPIHTPRYLFLYLLHFTLTVQSSFPRGRVFQCH